MFPLSKEKRGCSPYLEDHGPFLQSRIDHSRSMATGSVYLDFRMDCHDHRAVVAFWPYGFLLPVPVLP